MRSTHSPATLVALLVALFTLTTIPAAGAQGLTPGQPCVLGTADCVEADEPRLIDEPMLIELEIPLIEQQESLIEQQERLIDQPIPCVLATATCVDPDQPRLIDQPTLIEQEVPLIEQQPRLIDQQERLIDQEQPCVLATAVCTTLPSAPDPITLPFSFAGNWSGPYSGPLSMGGCSTTASGTLSLRLEQPAAGGPVTGTAAYTGNIAIRNCGGTQLGGADNCSGTRIGPATPTGNTLRFQLTCAGSTETVNLTLTSATSGTGNKAGREGSTSWDIPFTLTRA